MLVLCLALLPAGTARATGFDTPGVRAAAPTTGALDTTLSQLTDGLTPAEVTTRRECAAAAPGQAACFARTLVRRGSRARIHPRARARRTFTNVFPTRHTGIAPATAAGAPAASAPGAGTPAWLQQAYDLTYLSQTAGTGDVVGIVDAYDDPTAEADLATYRSRYGLPACTTANGCFRKLNQNGSATGMPAVDNGWAEEISLDLDAVSALCPNCKIVLVEANSNYQNDLAAAIATAVAAGARQVSNSYGAGEPYQDPYLGRTFPGVTLLASTGDNGTMAAGWSAYPAAFPGYVAVGGTSLALSGGAPTARGFGESAWSGAGSGCNTNSGIVKPSWQSDTGCGGRAYADVSAVADPNTGLIAYSSERRRLVPRRRHEPLQPARRRLHGGHRDHRHDRQVGLRQQRAAQRPGQRQQRQLLDQLHLQRRHGLRRPDRHGLDLRRAGLRRARRRPRPRSPRATRSRRAR